MSWLGPVRLSPKGAKANPAPALLAGAVGMQLVAAYGREDLLIRIAAQLEQAHPWASRVPPVFAGS